MFDKEKVQNYITEFLPWTLKRYNVTNPRQIDGRKFTTIENELWKDLIYKGLVPRGTNNPQSSESMAIYNEVERMFRDSWNALSNQEMHNSYGREDEETASKDAEFISADEINRFIVQMSDEEQNSMSIRDIAAEILKTKPENIKNITTSGSGWEIQTAGDMNDSENISDEDDDDMEEWEKEGYPSEVAYKNRWRDYED